ncbi:MAG: hypothetical protein J0I98_15700 [Mesorhizobium sp.]|nr:hypothetical protein [Mesorhizobium sp.]MBN9244232.1 hypothetical protein [Mesorhizobium sp.]
MIGEAAADICTSIAQEVRSLRASGEPTNALLDEMVGSLCTASAVTMVDALALAAVSRRMLSATIGEVQADDLEGKNPSRLTAILALTFLHRAIGVLETETGLGAEGFTGEADALN